MVELKYSQKAIAIGFSPVLAPTGMTERVRGLLEPCRFKLLLVNGRHNKNIKAAVNFIANLRKTEIFLGGKKVSM